MIAMATTVTAEATTPHISSTVSTMFIPLPALTHIS